MANRIQDAEFEDLPTPPPGSRPTYGRRTVAAAATDPTARARAGAEALDAVAGLAQTAARMATAVGPETVADKAADAADLAEASADLVRTGVVAAEGVQREIGPLKKSWAKLVDRAKAAGLVGAPKRQVLVLHKRPVGPVRGTPPAASTDPQTPTPSQRSTP